jgi:lipoprotein NlpD
MRLATVGLVGLFALSGCTHNSPAPVRTAKPKATKTSPVRAQGNPANGAWTHTVLPGETLYAIARRYGVTAQDLIAWNNLSNPNQLEVGQALRVAPAAASAPSGVVVETVPVLAEPGVSTALPASVPPPQDAGVLAIKNEPRGGKEPYSDIAWARVQAPGAAVSESALPANTAPANVLSGNAANNVPPVAALPGSGPAWIWPVRGKILAGFDAPVGGDAKMRNKGIDIAGVPGTPVLAASGGKVVYAGNGLRGYGSMVIIKHDDNYLTAYAHNRTLLVKEDDKVTKGQKIAELGSSDTDRPKLHFELRSQGQPVDPLKHLPAL